MSISVQDLKKCMDSIQKELEETPVYDEVEEILNPKKVKRSEANTPSEALEDDNV